MIILASQSPRRKELLSLITNDFKVIPANVLETTPENIAVNDTAMYLSKIKAEAVYNDAAADGDIIIGADTIVVLNNEVFGKPVDYNDAFKMLKKLSGSTHLVITGVTIIKKDNNQKILKSFCNITEVEFYKLSDAEIINYINSNEPFDKAGGYGIQGDAALFVKRINGDYNNVVGLPVSQLNIEIKKIG